MTTNDSKVRKMSDFDEREYERGFRAAMTTIIQEANTSLGYQQRSEKGWLLEREAAIAVLRDACGAYGDNEWEPSLHLTDVIDKHLVRHLDASVGRGDEET